MDSLAFRPSLRSGRDLGMGRSASARLTQGMKALRNALLYYARGVRVDLAFAETDLHKIVDEVLDSLTPAWREAGVEIRPRRCYRPCAAVPPASAKSSATSSPMP
jgi:light-regulated signal transduction histidine kinase (bacteriophytochrome)